MNELKSIITNIDSKNKSLKKIMNTDINPRKNNLNELKKRKKYLEESIQKFLNENKQTGIKDTNNGIAIITEKKTKHISKKNKEAKNDVYNVLLHYMNEDKAKRIFSEIESAKKNTIEQFNLKVIDIKKI